LLAVPFKDGPDEVVFEGHPSAEKKNTAQLLSVRALRASDLSAESPDEQFDMLNLVADPKWQGQVPAMKANTSVEWLAQVDAAKPKAASLEKWRQACAIRSLRAGVAQPLSGALADALLSAPLRGEHSWRESARLLLAIGELMPVDDTKVQAVKHRQARWRRYHDVYLRLAARMAQQQDLLPYSLLAPMLLASSLPLEADIGELFDSFAQLDMIHLSLAGKWREMDDLLSRLQAFHRPALVPALSWAAALADRQQHGPRADSGNGIGYWSFPWRLQDSRSERLFKSNFELALARRLREDACRLLTTRQADVSNFYLVEDLTDPRLWIRVEQSSGDLLRRRPELRQTMRKEFGRRAALRLTRGKRDGNARLIESVTTQFRGTLASAEAFMLLGDQAFQRGRFESAAAHYAAAAEFTDLFQAKKIAIRRRLVAAKMGRQFGEPATESIRIGEQEFSSQQIEQLVAASKRDRQQPQVVIATRGRAPNIVPSPARFTAVKLADAKEIEKVTSLPGITAERGHPQIIWQRLTRPGRFASGNAVSWRHGTDLHHQNLASGKPWQTRIPGLLIQPGTRGKGKKPFDQQPRRLFLASPPIASGDRVFGLFEEQLAAEGGGKLNLIGFEAATGKKVTDQPLYTMRAFRSGKRTASIHVVGTRYVVLHDGVIVCGEIAGPIRWMRTQDRLPRKIAGTWAVVPPWPAPQIYLDTDRLYVTQPEVPYLDCIDLKSGRLKWSSPVLGTSRPLGIVGERLLVETSLELLGLNSTTGEIVWRRPAEHLPMAIEAGEPGGLLYARLRHRPLAKSQKEKAKRPTSRSLAAVELVWIDPAKGDLVGIASLDKLVGPEVSTARFGPWLSDGKDLLVAVQAAVANNPLALFRLTPSGKASGEKVDRWRQLFAMIPY
jgi:hypothetical protein